MTAPSETLRLSEEAVVPLRTLDPAAQLDDLGWLDGAIDDVRVVAIGESAHFNREFLQLRHRLLRYLVERHGFSAYAMESGFVEGGQVDAWLRRGAGTLGSVLAQGMTSLMGLWEEMRALLEWMRRHNQAAAHQVGFHGIDLSGSNASLLPGLDAVTGYLASVDPEYRVDPALRETAAAFAAPSPFAIGTALSAYPSLPRERRDALTAGLADLMAYLIGRRFDHLRRTTVEAYERAVRTLQLTVAIDAMFRDLARGQQDGMVRSRDAAIADTVEWVLRREERIVLAAHNGHVQRWPITLPGIPAAPTAGVHLSERLGPRYLVIGTTSESGQVLTEGPEFATGTLFTELAPPRPGSLDALMAATHDEPFATDLRTLSPADAGAVREGVSDQRIGSSYSEVNALTAYDIVIHLPHVTPAAPDRDALDHAPGDVQEAFSTWKPE